MAAFFHLFDKTDVTGYNLILGRYFKQKIGIEFLNGALYFSSNEVQISMVYMGY